MKLIQRMELEEKFLYHRGQKQPVRAEVAALDQKAEVIVHTTEEQVKKK